MTTLRDAVLWCCRLDIPWTAEDVAQMAGTAIPAAKAYLVRQAQALVIVSLPEGRFKAGNAKALTAFRAQVVNPKPGGNGAAYRRAKEARDRLLTAEAEARRNGTLTVQAQSAELINDQQGAGTITDFSDGVTREEAARFWRVSLPTIDRWCRLGRLRYGRTPSGHRRVYLSELMNRNQA